MLVRAPLGPLCARRDCSRDLDLMSKLFAGLAMLNDMPLTLRKHVHTYALDTAYTAPRECGPLFFGVSRKKRWTARIRSYNASSSSRSYDVTSSTVSAV